MDCHSTLYQDDSILRYYQQLDDKLEEGFSIDVLDDYLDEAREIQENNPWLTYSLGLHRCREMGMSCHSIYKWLDWLDERPLTRTETLNVIETLGVISDDAIDSTTRALLDEAVEWKQFCGTVERLQQEILLAITKHRLEVPGNSGTASGSGSGSGNAYLPWNPIRGKPTPWIDMNQLRRHTGTTARPWWSTSASQWWVILTVVVLVLAELLR